MADTDSIRQPMFPSNAGHVTPPASPTSASIKQQRKIHNEVSDEIKSAGDFSSRHPSAEPLQDLSVGTKDHTQALYDSNDSWPESYETVVAGAYNYLAGNSGKNIRSQFMKAFNAWLDVPEDDLKIIDDAIAMLHTASLLVDDIEDDSDLRRGFPVAHKIFGIPQTLNSANYHYFCAMKQLQRLGNAEVMTAFVDELLQLHRGQGMDLHWRDTLTCPTEDEYLGMVRNKTGGLFRLCVKVMQAQSKKSSPPDCIPLADAFGLLFQIRDDYQNICSPDYAESKGEFEDLTEGKFSFPVVHSILHSEGNPELLNILRQRPTDLAVKRYAIRYIEGTGSFEHTRRTLDALMKRARTMVDSIDGGPALGVGAHALLDRLEI